MPTAIDHTSKIHEKVNELCNHSISLERENFKIKKAIRVLAKNMALDESGRSTIELTQEEADFIKKTCIETNLFLEPKDQTPKYDAGEFDE